MGQKNQHYLHKNRHGTFAFRWRPPRHVARLFSQPAFVYSLGTKDASVARSRALPALVRLDHFLTSLRAMKPPKDHLLTTELVRSLLLPDGTEHKVDYDPSNPGEVAEANRILDALVQGERISDPEAASLQRTLEPSLRLSRGRANTPILSDAFKAFCAEKRSAGVWKDPIYAERYDYGPIVDELIEVAGDLPIGNLAVGHLRRLKERVLADGTSPTTNAKKLGRLKSFIDWAREHQQLTTVSTGVLQLPKRKTDAPHYEQCSDGDLAKLFDSPMYREQSFVKASEFWFPLLGLYTGARINELAQLHVTDIADNDGVMILSINDEGTKRLKTTASRRKVPLHPLLLEAGLLDYHQLIVSEGWQRLFAIGDLSVRQRTHGIAYLRHLPRSVWRRTEESGPPSGERTCAVIDDLA